MTHKLPVLYSFRRCPYAMRARMAIYASQCPVELREVELKNKPQALLKCSPKATVPVLVLTDGSVIDESLDIMQWALNNNDPQHWLAVNQESRSAAEGLIEENDQVFKVHLDDYKYADRFPQKPASYYRAQAMPYLEQLEQRLAQQAYLFGHQLSYVDIAVMPFIRQFAHVDSRWFYATDLNHCQHWLDNLLASENFKAIMVKHKPWRAGQAALQFP